ncbi:MAG: SDR family NAD(P)-dependent oxidoreductase [Candidatus Reddybacter sp.]
MKHFGTIDYFLNNAGVEGVVAPIVDSPIDAFDQVMAVNIKGVWLGLKYVIPAMLDNGGGSIVMTPSMAGLKGTPNISPYITSKHAVVGMMRSLESGFAPGQEEAAKAQLSQMMPMGRYGEPEEVANLMAFLCSDDASFCSGGVSSADGGGSAM